MAEWFSRQIGILPSIGQKYKESGKAAVLSPFGGSAEVIYKYGGGKTSLQSKLIDLRHTP